MNFAIRTATTKDSADILSIYSYYIENTAVSFETETPSLSVFTERMEGILDTYPYLVCEIEGELVGYAHASRHRERAAYRYDVDVSVYVKNGVQAKGIGTALYERLFEKLATENYYTAYAGITLPNARSCALHKKFGFREIGVHHKTGFKFGKWHDVLWMEKALKDYSILPE